MPRFSAIEGLRAWLAWAVVASHLVQTLGMDALGAHWQLLGYGGEVGVMTFIVISGFVITGLILDKHEPYPRYLLRRAFRIFPAYWVAWGLALAVLPYAIAALAHEPWSRAPGFTYDELIRGWDGVMRRHPLPEQALHLTLLQGLVPDSVWPQTNNAVLGPSWSLTLEWQFYLIAPVLIWMLTRPRWRFFAAFLIAAGAVAFHEEVFGLFFLPTFFPGAGLVFLVGIASRICFNELKRLSFSTALIPPVLVMGLLYRDLMWLALWAVVLAFLVSGEHWRAGNGRIASRVLSGALESAPARYLGARSYSVYLLHLPVMQFATWVIATHVALTQTQFFFVLAAVTTLATLILSDLLYRVVEQPMIALGARLAGPRPAAASAA